MRFGFDKLSHRALLRIVSEGLPPTAPPKGGEKDECNNLIY